MKRLLSVVAILVLAASLLPMKADAGLRGAFDFLTNGDNLIRGKFSPTLRGGVTSGAGTAASPRLERWFGFVTLSGLVGSESTGEIWIYRNIDQLAGRGISPFELKRDPTGAISYIDPAWSKDGKWLAYVQTDNSVSQASIYVQQYDISTATDGNVALGSPILIADGTGGRHNRHPSWKYNGTGIAYDSDAFGPSIDLWTVDVSLDAVAHTGTVNEASRTRHQLGLETDEVTRAILNGKAEFKPAWSPDGSKIAYVTNRFGAFQIQLLTPTANGLGESVAPLEANPALITHDNPSWSSNGLDLYYDAPGEENPNNPQDIFKVTVATGQKCNIFIDLSGDVDADVSQYPNVTPNGITYNYFLFISQAAGFGVTVWRGEAIQNCIPALPFAVAVSPSQLDLDRPHSAVITTTLSYPASTRAAGYVPRAANVGGDGIRMRNSIISSPTVMGLPLNDTPDDDSDCSSMFQDVFNDPSAFGTCAEYISDVAGNGAHGFWIEAFDTTGGTDHRMSLQFPSRDIADRIVALGLVNKFVPIEVRAYSNRIGQQLKGFGYVKLFKKNLAPSAVVLRQNYPNPFNPVTKINFSIEKAGIVDVRVFNTRGELVRTISNQWYPQGSHAVSWDGKTLSGGRAPSGIYYIRAASAGSTDVIKAVLAK